MRRAALMVIGALLVVAAPATAQVPVPPGDFCFEVDHSGQNPFNSPSAAMLFFTFPPEFAGTWADVSLMGPTGDAFGAGEVGPDGLTIVDVPLFSYGDHAVTEGILDSGGADVMIDVSGLDFVVDASEPSCNPGDLALVAPATTIPEVVATTTTSAPAAAETTTTTEARVAVASTEGTSEVTTTTMSTTSPEADVSGGFPWLPVGAGIIILAGGYIVYRGSKDPCEDELAAWLAAQAACDAARAAADAAQAACDAANDKVGDLERRRAAVCEEWPPACWGSDDGGWIENAGDPSSRITQRDLHLRRMALGGVWDEYQSGNMTAQEVEEAWKNADTPEFRQEMRSKDAAAKGKLQEIDGALADARADAAEACRRAADATREADAACAKAAAAKAAYDACMGAAAATPPPPPTSTGGGEDPGGEPPPPTSPGGTAPPPQPPTSHGEEEDPEPACCPEGVWAGYGWTTGGIIGFGVESTIAHFICLCDTSKAITLASRSLRAGLALGGETSFFLALMWGVPHTSGVPIVWADKSAAGWDGDLSLGPSISKGIKSVVKDVGTGAGWDYLKWAAKNNVPWSNLDPRRVKELAPSATGVAVGALKDQVVGQQMDPQLIVVPFGAGVQVGVWRKWCESVRVGEYESCGCVPVSWP